MIAQMGQNNTGTAPAHGVNDTRYQDYVEKLSKFAEDAGSGEDALAKSYLLTCEYAYQQVLDLDKHKHGRGMDDAWRNAATYWEKRNKKAVFGTKKGSERKLASTFRTMIKLGGCQKWGVGEPIGNVNRLLTIWRDLHAKKENSGKLKDAANVLTSYARRQMKDDNLLTQADLNAMCFLPVPGKVTIEEVLERIRDTAQKLYEGKHDAGRAETMEVYNIIEYAKTLLGRLAEAQQNNIEVEGVDIL